MNQPVRFALFGGLPSFFAMSPHPSPPPDWTSLPGDLWHRIAEMAESAAVAAELANEPEASCRRPVARTVARLKVQLALGATCGRLRILFGSERLDAMRDAAAAVVAYHAYATLWGQPKIRDPYIEPVRAVLQLALETYEPGAVRVAASLLDLVGPRVHMFLVTSGAVWLRRAAVLLERCGRPPRSSPALAELATRADVEVELVAAPTPERAREEARALAARPYVGPEMVELAERAAQELEGAGA